MIVVGGETTSQGNGASNIALNRAAGAVFVDELTANDDLTPNDGSATNSCDFGRNCGAYVISG